MVPIDPRKLIGQALGILMERYRIDSDQAFELLKRSSQQSGAKLIDIARSVVSNRRPRS